MSEGRIWKETADQINNIKINGYFFIYAQIHPYYRLVLLVNNADGHYPIGYTVLYSMNTGAETGVYTDGSSLFLKKNTDGGTLNMTIPLFDKVTITENQTVDYNNLHLIF